VAFLDADDVWLPDKLERQLPLFQADPDLGVVYSRRRLMNEDGVEVVYEQPVLYRGMVLQPLFRTNFVCQSSAVVRRAVLDDVGLFDEGCPVIQDYDLWLRVAAHYHFDYVDEPLVKYRIGHASLTARTENRLLVALDIMRRFLDTDGGRNVIPPDVVRWARAETYFHLSLTQRHRAPWSALRSNLKALAHAPGYWTAWKGLVSLALPEQGRRLARRLLGKPVDWTVRSPVALGRRAPG
jgi:hypothetical protein